MISTLDIVQLLGSSVQRVVNSRELPLSGVGGLASLAIPKKLKAES